MILINLSMLPFQSGMLNNINIFKKWMAHLSVYVNSVKPCSWHPDPRTDTLTSCIMNADGRHSQSSHRREAQWTSSAVEEHYMLLVVLPSWSLKTKKSVQQRSLMSGSKSPATINKTWCCFFWLNGSTSKRESEEILFQGLEGLEGPPIFKRRHQ